MTEAGRPNIRTFIYGSTVSRETFEYLPADFDLLHYVARQSMISAGSDASNLLRRLKPIDSSLHRRLVHADLAGSLHDTLAAAAPEIDLLLIDLVDERGGVIDLGDRYVTKLQEFWRAGGAEATQGNPHVAFGTDEHYALWSAAASRFHALLEDLELVERTLVLRTPWAGVYETGHPYDGPNWLMDPATANARYSRYFRHLDNLGLRGVTLPDDLARTSADHRWGASPFHYTQQAYDFLANEIEGVAESRTERAIVTKRAIVTRRATSMWGNFTDVRDLNELSYLQKAPTLLTVWHGGYPIDLKIDDVASRTTLVSFHAALGTSGAQPPIFTGRTITDDIGVNRIFVSDPGLLASKNLGLAWYLGTSSVDLNAVLTSAISSIQTLLGAEHLIFFGMSGGGFASLNYSYNFPGSVAVPVNPQTRILDYGEIHWDAMARECFGTRSADESRHFLESHARADLRRLYGEGFQNSVIYLQNATDGHVRHQMIPWFEAIQWDSRASVLVKNWGKGHVPPPVSELRALMSKVAQVDGDWGALAGSWGARPTTLASLRQESRR